MELIGLCIGVFILIKIAGFIWQPEIKKTKPSFPALGYELFYTDEKTDDKVDGVIYSKLLESKQYEIKGKPDYVYKRKNRMELEPVELKSGAIGDGEQPRMGDLMQLVAYFLILEDEFGVKPVKGRLIYKDSMFVVKNSTRLRNELVTILEDMREMLETGEQEVEPSFVKCKHCVCRGTVCEYCKE